MTRNTDQTITDNDFDLVNNIGKGEDPNVNFKTTTTTTNTTTTSPQTSGGRCDARNYRENEDHECCSRSSPCAENEGDCDSDADCQGDLVCGQDNCPSNWGSSEADCCKSINVNIKTTTDYEDYYAYDSLGHDVNLKTTTDYEDYYAEAPCLPGSCDENDSYDVYSKIITPITSTVKKVQENNSYLADKIGIPGTNIDALHVSQAINPVHCLVFGCKRRRK